ncbi:carbohydrate ABC transporter permease [Paenibacillus terrigena]|uniref:carbohydrate ABC transporter permease n=1 Tax=Paenibacillus terrigena TaxID=369333 RepID=UPI0028D3D126|nr:carbohydrate ABC transporter permease [Paenibacillus terrigena]
MAINRNAVTTHVSTFKRIAADNGAATAPLRRAAARRTKTFLSQLFIYSVLLSLAFVFIYPMLFIFSSSLMQADDVADATVKWIPKQLSFANYTYAFQQLDFWRSFMNSTIISLGSAVVQVVSCSVVGYGFARFRFPGRGLWLALVLFTFLVPPQTIIVPLFLQFSDLGWLNTYLPFIAPGLFGHGLKGALFVLIFIQFFSKLPNQLEEAALIDGAGAFRTFRSIMFPLARPAMLVVFLFSIVWHWTDTYEPTMYLMEPQKFNMTQQLSKMNGEGNEEGAKQLAATKSVIGEPPTKVNRVMAGALLSILPLLALYLFAQRHFVESVERTGIAGD